MLGSKRERDDEEDGADDRHLRSGRPRARARRGARRRGLPRAGRALGPVRGGLRHRRNRRRGSLLRHARPWRHRGVAGAAPCGRGLPPSSRGRRARPPGRRAPHGGRLAPRRLRAAAPAHGVRGRVSRLALPRIRSAPLRRRPPRRVARAPRARPRRQRGLRPPPRARAARAPVRSRPPRWPGRGAPPSPRRAARPGRPGDAPNGNCRPAGDLRRRHPSAKLGARRCGSSGAR